MQRSQNNSSSIESKNRYKVPKIMLPVIVKSEIPAEKPQPNEFNDTLLEDLTDI